MGEMNRKIKVLIVDDSHLFQEILSKGLSTDPGIRVVARAGEPFEARDRLLETNPDVVICDVEMPRMNGITFVKRLMAQYPLPVIMISARGSSRMEAIKVGAIDFVKKPDMGSVQEMKIFIESLIEKIKKAAASQKKDIPRVIPGAKGKIIAIGASTGGTEAILKVLKSLPSNVPGIVIVQHIPPDFSRMFAERLNTVTGFNVKEAQSGDYVESGHVLIAPGDKHMSIKRTGARYQVECFNGERVNGHCPSVDVLFDSVSANAGNSAIGVILTGMGADGAKGLLRMRNNGARTIGQDEKSCAVYGMPKSAYNMGAVEKQVPLDKVGEAILSFLP